MLQENEIPTIDEKCVTLGDWIGKETSGSVYMGKWNETKVSIKKISSSDGHLSRECLLHASIPHHPSIVAFFGVVKNTYEPRIIMELTPNGSIFDYLYKQKESPTNIQSCSWALQVAEGMEHLHNHDIVHRNLKSANIHLSSTLIAKIGGFGVARHLVDTVEQSDERGTYRWMAPEVMETTNAKINKFCDVFSYGMLLYELFVHKRPYESLGDAKACSDILKQERPLIPSSLPKRIQFLMPECWAHDPNHRPNFTQLRHRLQTIA